MFNSKVTTSEVVIVICALSVFLLMMVAVGLAVWLIMNGYISKTLKKSEGERLP